MAKRKRQNRPARTKERFTAKENSHDQQPAVSDAAFSGEHDVRADHDVRDEHITRNGHDTRNDHDARDAHSGQGRYNRGKRRDESSSGSNGRDESLSGSNRRDESSSERFASTDRFASSFAPDRFEPTRTRSSFKRSKNEPPSNATIDIFLTQEMDFRLPRELATKKPHWKTNPFVMSFAARVDDAHPAASFKSYPSWLAPLARKGALYENSRCVHIAHATTTAESSSKAKKKRKAAAASNFAHEFTEALEVLAAAAMRSIDAQDESLRIDSEHIIIDPDPSEHALNVSGLDAWLFYEVSLRQWQMVYHFSLSATAEHLSALLDASRSLRHERADLYNLIRDAFALSDGVDKVLPSIRRVQSSAKNAAAQICKALYGFKKRSLIDSLFVFPNDRTEVSLFVRSRNAYELSAALVNESERAETSFDLSLDLLAEQQNINDAAYRDLEAFRCGERFDTILIDEEAIAIDPHLAESAQHDPSADDATKSGEGQDDLAEQQHACHPQLHEARFMPLFFHRMLMDSYLRHTTEAMQQIERAILGDEGSRKIVHARYFNALIDSVEYASFEHESFKRSIGQDHSLVYSKIEDKQERARSFASLRNFASYLSSYLGRSRQERIIRSGRWRNALLFLILILGIAAILESRGAIEAGMAYLIPTVQGWFDAIATSSIVTQISSLFH